MSNEWIDVGDGGCFHGLAEWMARLIGSKGRNGLYNIFACLLACYSRRMRIKDLNIPKTSSSVFPFPLWNYSDGNIASWEKRSKRV